MRAKNVQNQMVQTQKRENYFLQRILRPSWPVNLSLSVADVCNLKCKMCGTYGENATVVRSGSTYKGLMSFEDWRYIIDSIPSRSPITISPTSYGEPLLNKELFDMLRYAKAKGIKFNGFYTNGMLLTEELQKELQSSEIPQLVVSIDGMKESSEKQRVGSNWDVIVNQVVSLVKMNRSLKGKLVVGVNMVRTFQSTEEIDEYVRFWGEKGLSYISVQSSTRETDNGCIWNKDSLMNPRLYPENPPQNFPCVPFLYRWMLIRSDLQAYSVCCRDWFYSGKNDFKESNIKQCWTSKGYQKFLNKQYHNVKGPICFNCEYKYITLSQQKESFINFGRNRYRVKETFYSREYFLI